MKRFVSEDEGFERVGAKEGSGQQLDSVLARLRHLDEEHKRLNETREKLRQEVERLRREAEKLLEALHQEINETIKSRPS